MSNIRTVAKLAGVSVATVSRALATPDKVSAHSLQKVHDAIAAVGYKPNMLARNFRSARSYALVVLVPDLTNPFFADIIEAVEDRAQQLGYAVLLGNTRDDDKREQDYIRRVETRLADGVIQLRPYAKHSQQYQPTDIPWVNTCGVADTPGLSVRIDNVAALESMVAYMAQIGHNQVGLVTGLRDNPHTKDRQIGFDNGIAKYGVTSKPEWKFEGDFTLMAGIRAGEAFAKMTDRPTAILCMSDQMAIGVIQSLKAAGIRVPEDVSVTGFDDIPYARHGNPAITTVSQPAQAMGAAAVDLVLRAVNGEAQQQTEVVLPTQLVVRASTMALNKTAK